MSSSPTKPESAITDKIDRECKEKETPKTLPDLQLHQLQKKSYWVIDEDDNVPLVTVTMKKKLQYVTIVQLLKGGFFEALDVDPPIVALVDEEGQLKKLAKNNRASTLCKKLLVGTVIVVRASDYD